MRKRKNMDMTSGVIWKQLVEFAIPLLLGLIFQQLYSLVDALVVGNFIGETAFAGVSLGGNIINVLIGFFSGLATGATVVIARLFGAHDDGGVSKAVHTAILMTLGMSVVFTIVGVAMVPTMLRLMNTPEGVFDDAATFLRIYFTGVSGLMIYNMGAGILRAVGDSRRPLYFLIFSAIVNIVGDLIFVLVFHMGVAGVGCSTVTAQFLSAILVVVTLLRANGAHRLSIHSLHFSMPMFKSIVKIGLPTALQSTITSFSNVFVQGYINIFGKGCIAGWGAYSKINQLALLPMQSISMASTTFVGQNLGANDVPRAKRGVGVAMAMSCLSTAVLTVPLMVFARPLVGIMGTEPEMLSFGVMFMLWISPFYLFACVNDILAGVLRGAGLSQAPMYIMLACYVVIRQIYLYFISPVVGSVLPIALGYPLGWVLCAIMQYIYYRRCGWEQRQARMFAS